MIPLMIAITLTIMSVIMVVSTAYAILIVGPLIIDSRGIREDVYLVFKDVESDFIMWFVYDMYGVVSIVVLSSIVGL